MNKTNGRYITTVYAILIATSAVQFLCNIFLERFLPKAEFSKASLILSFYMPYFVLVELGIQGELVRRFTRSQTPAEILAPAKALRILGAGIALLAMVVNGWLSGMSSESIICLVLFGACMIPAAGLYTIEALGYSSQNIWQVIALRTSRGVASVAFSVLTVLAFAKGMGNTVYTTLVYAVFPLTFAAVYLAVKPRSFAKISSFKESTLALFKSTFNLCFNRSLVWIYATTFFTLIVYANGEHNLAEFTISQILLVPVGILVQVIVSDAIAKHQRETGFSAWQKHGMTLFLLTGVFVYAGAFSLQPILNFVFHQADISQVRAYLWPLLIALLLGAISDLIALRLQTLGLHIYQYIAPAAGIACVLAGFYLIPRIMPPQFTPWLYAGGAMSMIFVQTFGIIRKK
jgi:hypothetical protein